MVCSASYAFRSWGDPAYSSIQIEPSIVNWSFEPQNWFLGILAATQSNLSWTSVLRNEQKWSPSTDVFPIQGSNFCSPNASIDTGLGISGQYKHAKRLDRFSQKWISWLSRLMSKYLKRRNRNTRRIISTCMYTVYMYGFDCFCCLTRVSPQTMTN